MKMLRHESRMKMEANAKRVEKCTPHRTPRLVCQWKLMNVNWLWVCHCKWAPHSLNSLLLCLVLPMILQWNDKLGETNLATEDGARVHETKNVHSFRFGRWRAIVVMMMMTIMMKIKCVHYARATRASMANGVIIKSFADDYAHIFKAFTFWNDTDAIFTCDKKNYRTEHALFRQGGIRAALIWHLAYEI